MGHEAVVEQCRAIEEWAAAVGQQKRADFSAPNRDLDSQIQVSSHVPAKQPVLQQGRWILPYAPQHWHIGEQCQGTSGCCCCGHECPDADTHAAGARHIVPSDPFSSAPPCHCIEQALVGEKIQDAYRSGATKQQRGAIVGPLWEEARVALVGQARPGSGNGVEAGSDSHGIEAADVDSALKARQLSPAGICLLPVIAMGLACFQQLRQELLPRVCCHLRQSAAGTLRQTRPCPGPHSC